MFSSSQNRTASRVVRVFWNDGLLDILAGLALSLIGCAWMFGMVPLGAVAPAIAVPFWMFFRARVTEPRLGFVEMSDVQQARNRNFLLASAALGIVTFLLIVVAALAVSSVQAIPGLGIAALPATIIALMALMTAAITSLDRFVLYAVFLVAGGIVVAWLDVDPGWSLLAGGLAAILGGAIVLTRFISRHPITREP